MNEFRAIARMNASAVELLEDRKYEEARLSFLRLLCCLDTLICLNVVGSERISYQDLFHEDQLGAGSTYNVELGKSDCSIYTYSRAFLLGGRIPTSLPQTAAILFYNMGLVYHLEGLESGQSTLFVKASDQYLRSINILEAFPYQRGVLPVLKAALYNNLSDLYTKNLEVREAYHVRAKFLQVVPNLLEVYVQINPDDLAFFSAASAFFTFDNSLCMAPAA